MERIILLPADGQLERPIMKEHHIRKGLRTITALVQEIHKEIHTQLPMPMEPMSTWGQELQVLQTSARDSMIPIVKLMQVPFPIPQRTAMDMAHQNPMEQAHPVEVLTENHIQILEGHPIPLPIAEEHPILSVMGRAMVYREAIPVERPIPTVTELRPATRLAIPIAHPMEQPIARHIL